MLAFDPPFSYIDSRLFTCTLSIGGAKIHRLQLRSQSDFAHCYHTGLKDRMIDSGRVKDLPGTEEGCSVADSPNRTLMNRLYDLWVSQTKPRASTQIGDEMHESSQGGFRCKAGAKLSSLQNSHPRHFINSRPSFYMNPVTASFRWRGTPLAFRCLGIGIAIS